MDKVERENLFVEWMSSPIHPTIKRTTLDAYMVALKKSFHVFPDSNLVLDIFAYYRLSDFQNFFQKIQQHSAYASLNKANNGSYQALLKKYEKYLIEMENLDDSHISKDDFIEWAILKKKAYNSNWITNYVKALKFTAFGLQENADLRINLFEIEDENTFRIAETKIRADKNFDVLNQESTQKSFSAALGRYSEFLSSEFYLSRVFFNEIVEDTAIDDEIKTEIERTVISRVGQSDFRRGIMRRDRTCLICHLPYSELLRASHIKPWAKSTNKERLDISNGFLLCANHDALFDKGFISFDENGNLEISKEISPKDYSKLVIEKSMSMKVATNQEKYLFYHRHEIFRH